MQLSSNAVRIACDNSHFSIQRSIGERSKLSGLSYWAAGQKLGLTINGMKCLVNSGIVHEIEAPGFYKDEALVSRNEIEELEKRSFITIDSGAAFVLSKYDEDLALSISDDELLARCLRPRKIDARDYDVLGEVEYPILFVACVRTIPVAVFMINDVYLQPSRVIAFDGDLLARLTQDGEIVQHFPDDASSVVRESTDMIRVILSRSRIEESKRPIRLVGKTS